MSQPLRWDLYGNDQLTQTLDKLARAVDTVGRKMDASTTQARQMGRGFDDAARQADRLGDEMSQTGSQAAALAGRVTIADRAASAMHTTMGRGAAVIATAATALRSFAFTAALAGVAAGGALAGVGIQTAAANETAMVSFRMLLGDAERASAFMKRLQDFAAATPFDLPTLRTAASGLLTVGIEADRIIPLLTRIGDATAAMGTGAVGVDRAVYALKQMSLAGKVTKEDLNQLTEAGIPALDALAAHLGKTVPQVLDMISAGKVRPEDMFRALETSAGASMQRISGMMEQQSATLSGKWSSFKDNASQALATFFEPMLPGAKVALDWLATNVPAGLNKVKEMGRQVRDIFAGSGLEGKFMDALRDLKDKILPKLSESWDKILTTIEENKEGLIEFGRFITDVLMPAIGPLLVDAIDRVTNSIRMWTIIAANVVDAFTWMTRNVVAVLGEIMDAAVVAFGWVPGLGDKLRESNANFDAWAARIEAKLQELNGHTVTIGVQTFGIAPGAQGIAQSIGIKPSNSSRQLQAFAGGGWVDGPPGSAQLVVAHAGERVNTPEQQAALERGEGRDVEAVPVTINLDGYAVWQGLLRFKRRTKKPSLGLA